MSQLGSLGHKIGLMFYLVGWLGEDRGSSIQMRKSRQFVGQISRKRERLICGVIIEI
jgi:hypothetical protein